MIDLVLVYVLYIPGFDFDFGLPNIKAMVSVNQSKNKIVKL